MGQARIASLQPHPRCPHKLLPAHRACLGHPTGGESACRMRTPANERQNKRRRFELQLGRSAGPEHPPKGSSHRPDCRSSWTGSVERRGQRPPSRPAGKAGALEDAESKDASFPTRLALDSFDSPPRQLRRRQLPAPWSFPSTSGPSA